LQWLLLLRRLSLQWQLRLLLPLALVMLLRLQLQQWLSEWLLLQQLWHEPSSFLLWGHGLMLLLMLHLPGLLLLMSRLLSLISLLQLLLQKWQLLLPLRQLRRWLLLKSLPLRPRLVLPLWQMLLLCC
jgi:hypothetical protein